MTLQTQARDGSPEGDEGSPTDSSCLLSAEITVRYPGKEPVLRNLQLDIQRSEVLGLIGQSGSGKSTLALAILGLLGRQRARVEGRIDFQGEDLVTMRERDLRKLRGRTLGLVLQSPLASLNPALRLRTQLEETWRAHRAPSSTNADCESAIRSALTSVSLPDSDDFLRKRPQQLSVGQAQRVLIAMAVMHRPALAPRR